MLKRTGFSLASLTFLGMIGCGASVPDTGVPANIDMSKSYSPAAALPKMTPGDQGKAKAKAKSAPAAAEVATPPEPEAKK
ncbi:MAG: hypothetical protein WCJ40_13490 [Planctomycetota bacterium]|nr:hypothetical protein [Planctomycetota bacterium]RLS26761.1 MAG: hypothetical protein DWH73_00205 [Planctomycetota bacterium]